MFNHSSHRSRHALLAEGQRRLYLEHATLLHVMHVDQQAACALPVKRQESQVSFRACAFA